MDDKLLQMILSKLDTIDGRLSTAMDRLALMEGSAEANKETRLACDALKSRVSVLETKVLLYSGMFSALGLLVGSVITKLLTAS